MTCEIMRIYFFTLMIKFVKDFNMGHRVVKNVLWVDQFMTNHFQHHDVFLPDIMMVIRTNSTHQALTHVQVLSSPYR